MSTILYLFLSYASIVVSTQTLTKLNLDYTIIKKDISRYMHELLQRNEKWKKKNDLQILNSQIELFLRILQTVLEKQKRFS
jgi:hypothetical protein